MSILVVVETFEGALKKATLSAVTAGQKIGGEIDAVVIGENNQPVIDEIKGYGIRKVYNVSHGELANYRAEAYKQAVVLAAKESNASHIIATATTTGKDLMPRVTVALSAAMASDIIDVVKDGDASLYKRPAFAGNLVGTVKLNKDIHVLTCRGANFDSAENTGSVAEVVDLDASSLNFDVNSQYVELKQEKSERPDLAEAGTIVSGGRGTKGDFTLIEQFADKLSAAVGATRAVVDAGWMPNDLQVGQTGKVVAPQLYFAIGISGAIQHIAGMKGSKVIVAINKDPEAPIFKISDYGLVGDLFKLVPELIEKA